MLHRIQEESRQSGEQRTCTDDELPVNELCQRQRLARLADITSGLVRQLQSLGQEGFSSRSMGCNSSQVWQEDCKEDSFDPSDTDSNELAQEYLRMADAIGHIRVLPDIPGRRLLIPKIAAYLHLILNSEDKIAHFQDFSRNAPLNKWFCAWEVAIKGIQAQHRNPISGCPNHQNCLRIQIIPCAPNGQRTLDFCIVKPSEAEQEK